MPRARLTVVALIWTALAAPPLAAQGTGIDAPTTIVVVERSTPDATRSADGKLSTDRSRAFDLLPMLDHAGIAAVYSTSDAASFDTGRLVAEHLGVSRIPYDFDGQEPSRLARTLLQSVRDANPGRTVLVVLPREVLSPFVEAATRQRVDRVLHDRSVLVLTLGGESPSLLHARF